MAPLSPTLMPVLSPLAFLLLLPLLLLEHHLLLPLLLLPDAVAAGVAVAMAPTPPVTVPLSWSYLRECETLISGLPSQRRYHS